MRGGLLLMMALGVTACDRGRREAHYPPPQPAAACPCECPAAAPGTAGMPPASGGPVAPGTAAAVDPGPQDAMGLMSSAARKMNHDDGVGCLSDLDQLVAADPRHDQHTQYMRGQCEMLSGKCQVGKQRIDAYMAYQNNTPVEQRVRIVEAMASMHCRGGDMTDRDRLLSANHRLMQGAYMQTLTSAECAAAHDTARALMKKVPPRDADDTTISNLPKSLYFTAANCFARAGDCKGARRAFEQGFPQDSLAKVKDPAAKQKILDSTFESVVSKCK